MRTGKVRAAVVQLDASGLTGGRAVLSATTEMVEEAARAGARLVVFPAHTGTLYVATELGLGSPLAAPWPVARAGEIADSATEWVRSARRLASGYGVTLLPGTVLWPAGVEPPVPSGAPAAPAWHHAAPVVSPDGRVAHWQVQTHLRAGERGLGWVAGVHLSPVDTPAGRLGVLIGDDLWYPEAARILALQDAALIACPAAVPAPYAERHQWRGLWQQVQQNQVLAVEAGLGGEGLGVRWQPRTAALAPVEMTPGETGWLARMESERSGVLIADLDLRTLAEVVRVYDIFSQLNPALYGRYLPAVYERWRTRTEIP
jgi:predicted amidohydrolase